MPRLENFSGYGPAVQCRGYVRNTQKTTENWMESVKYGWPFIAKFKQCIF